MRLLKISTCLILCVAGASAQTRPGAVAGTVSDAFGPISDAPIQAKNIATGAIFTTASNKSGAYDFNSLPAGAYDLTVNVPGLKGYQRKGVPVADGGMLTLDIRIEDTTQLNTLGEDTQAILADQRKHAPPAGSAPRTADGKPDLSGIWWSPRTVDPGKPEFLPKAQAVAKQRMDNNRIDSPQSHCMPGAVLRLGPVYETVQSPAALVIISDDDSPGFHQIYIDGRKQPKDPNPSWYGSSIGHWEGDTLVVDRIAFNDRVWLDQEAHPHSDKLHVVERYRRPDLGHLETEITVEDPGVLARPFTMKRISDLAPTEQVFEFICTENSKDDAHLRAK